MATLAHLNPLYHGEKAADFVGDRWVGSDKQAVTLSSTYFPFGLGRWACPGRFLAVSGKYLLLLIKYSGFIYFYHFFRAEDDGVGYT